MIIERYFPNWKSWEGDWQEWKIESMERGKTVVLIPARQGSTRIKDKNIRDVCGKPLLAYTAIMAKALKGVDRVIISTDSPEYCSIAENWGVEAPFLRPFEFSGPQVAPNMAFYHLLCHCAYNNYPVRTVITLAPTNPFRNLIRMQEMLDATLEHGFCTSVFRCQTGWIPGLNMKNMLFFKPLGQFHGSHVVLSQISSKQYYFITNPIELVDVDVEDDLCIAKAIIENDLYDFGMSL